MKEPLSPSHVPLCLIWVTSDRARIYHGLAKSNAVDAPIEIVRSDVFGSSARYYEQVAGAVRSCSRIVILGPDMAAFHFRTHLQEHEPNLYRKIGGFEAATLPTPVQIEAFFRKYGSV